MWTFPTCFKRNIHIYKSTVHIYVFTVDMILIHLRAVKVNLNYFPDKLRTSSTYKVKINVSQAQLVGLNYSLLQLQH